MRTLSTLAFCVIVVTAATAQDPEKVLAGVFARFDRDSNGLIERGEFPGSDEQFEALGPGSDGKVTPEEFAASPVARRLLAARVRDASQPRERADADALLERRLEAAQRLDRNRDGKVTREEWNGDAATFAELDLDADGDLDRADRTEARRRAPLEVADARLPEFHAPLDPPERLLKRLDRDGDGELTEAEVHGHKLAAAFAWADEDDNGKISPRELARLVNEVRLRVRMRSRGDARPEAYSIPFSSWDRDDDGRIDTAEWRGPKYLFPRIDQDRDAALSELEVERYVRSVEGSTFLERFDLDEDGRVTLEEFGGPPGAFRRADRNGDGVVSRADR